MPHVVCVHALAVHLLPCWVASALCTGTAPCGAQLAVLVSRLSCTLLAIPLTHLQAVRPVFHSGHQRL